MKELKKNETISLNNSSNLTLFILEKNTSYSFLLNYQLKKTYNFNIINFRIIKQLLIEFKQLCPSILLLDNEFDYANSLDILNFI